MTGVKHWADGERRRDGKVEGKGRVRDVDCREGSSLARVGAERGYARAGWFFACGALVILCQQA